MKDIIKDAETDGKSVRAVGAGWSLSHVTETNDYLVNTRPLNLIKVNFSEDDVATGVDPESILLSQCGASVAEVNNALFLVGRKALPTWRASDGQTIVGAFSTGTHGAAINFGSSQDNVRGIHVITSSTNELWIEPANKVLSDAFVEATMRGAKRINNEIFLTPQLFLLEVLE